MLEQLFRQLQPSSTPIEFARSRSSSSCSRSVAVSAALTALELVFMARFQPQSAAWSNFHQISIPLANDFRLPPVEMEATEKHKGKTIVKVISTGTMPLFPVLNS